MFQQLASMLQQQLQHQYPDLKISGDNYNPGGGRLQLAQFLGMAKMLVIAMIMFKFNPWAYFGHDVAGPTPNIVTWALENKIYACMMTFFLCNMVETQLISSGAFEVSVNGETVWSKLELGNPPQPQQLISLVREKLEAHANQIRNEEIDIRDQL